MAKKQEQEPAKPKSKAKFFIKNVGHVLRDIRIELELNQATLEKRSRIKQQSIARIEQTGSARFHVVRQLAYALGVSLDEISRRMGPIIPGDMKVENAEGIFFRDWDSYNADRWAAR
jgi:transcriptional regulator with XRE-family HTH domain